MPDNKIIPTILTDTLLNLEDQISIVSEFADEVQIDYVDGFFAPEITCCEAHLIEEAKLEMPFEAHLMVEDPGAQVEDWYEAGAERIIGHIEEMEDQLEFAEKVGELGLEVGLALNLETPLKNLKASLISGLDVVLLMAHEVGVQGVKFNPVVLDKIRWLRENFPNLEIEVDGGINAETIVQARGAGANIFAVGSAILESSDPGQEYKKLYQQIA